MLHQEKKYRVDSFAKIQRRLEEVGAKKKPEETSTHYYTHQKTNDVLKAVQSGNKIEIHKLEESNGRFNLKETIPLGSIEAGLQWLRDKGYDKVDVVKMANTDYEYKGGIVGLYTINDFLHSVILDFPPGQHEAVEKEFGLEKAERINIPYNKYLEKIGKLRSMKLN